MKTDNRKRNIPIRVWLSKSENAELSRKAKITGLPKSTVIRLLLNNYEPKEKPDTRFYEAMRQLSAIGNNINQIARSVNAGIAKPEDAKRGLYLLDQVYELMFRIANK